jgi:hypothetical protein
MITKTDPYSHFRDGNACSGRLFDNDKDDKEITVSQDKALLAGMVQDEVANHFKGK